jgi:hypothetical protein
MNGSVDSAPTPHTSPEPDRRDTSKRPARPAPRTRAGKPKRRPIAETRERAAHLRAKFPEITQAELARQLGISATRLRQVEQAEASAERSHPINGNAVAQLEEVSA